MDKRHKKDFTLDEFLQAAEDLKKHGRNVLMLMGNKLSIEGPFEEKGSIILFFDIPLNH